MASVNSNLGRQLFDISFMVSLECDLECSFCMYRSGPEAKGLLSLELVRSFINSLDPIAVNGFGLYGGEPSLFLKENQEIIYLLPPRKPVFVITNGAWSTDVERTDKFIEFALANRLYVIVSGTAEHRRNQNLKVLQALKEEFGNGIRLKEAEANFIPMGRLDRLPLTCTKRCDWDERPTRIAIKPSGDVIFQTCDGSYPVVGRASEGFPVIQKRLQEKFWHSCPA